MRKASDILVKYAKIQQLYPKSSIEKHRVIFWCDSLVKLQKEMTVEKIQSIRGHHEAIIQSEDSSVEGARARIIKAKNGYLASAIEGEFENILTKVEFISYLKETGTFFPTLKRTSRRLTK